jgi:hypothetical protein
MIRFVNKSSFGCSDGGMHLSTPGSPNRNVRWKIRLKAG